MSYASVIDEAVKAERERCAKIAAEFYTGIIRCKRMEDIEHVRMHVEYKWSAEVARRIRAQALT